MTSFPLDRAPQWIYDFGSPLYVYDADRMTAQYRRMQAAFDADISVSFHYACKALPHLAVLQVFEQLGAGLDAVSLEEVHLALHAGFSPERILFTPNGTAFKELEEAVALGVRITIDHLELLEEFAHTFGSTVPVCVRINPHILAGGNAKISVGHIDSKFGISIHQLRHLLRIVTHHELHIAGLHMHTGSDIVEVESFMRGVDVLLDVAQHFQGLEFLDFGSGFKVGYRPGEPTTDIEALGAAMSERMREFQAQYGSPVALVFEPGKFLVSEAGAFLTTVNSTKTTPSTLFAQVDSGFHHFPRPMLYDAYHHIENVSHPGGVHRLYTVVGMMCETDTLGYDRKIAEVRSGDILAFHNAGAYCSSMSSNYNSRVRPAELLLVDGVPQLIVRREDWQQQLARQVPLETLTLSL